MTRSGDEDCLNELLYEIETNPERKSRITFSKSIDAQTGFQKTDESRFLAPPSTKPALNRQNFLRHFHGLGALLHFSEVEELRVVAGRWLWA